MDSHSCSPSLLPPSPISIYYVDGNQVAIRLSPIMEICRFCRSSAIATSTLTCVVCKTQGSLHGLYMLNETRLDFGRTRRTVRLRFYVRSIGVQGLCHLTPTLHNSGTTRLSLRCLVEQRVPRAREPGFQTQAQQFILERLAKIVFHQLSAVDSMLVFLC